MSERDEILAEIGRRKAKGTWSFLTENPVRGSASRALEDFKGSRHDQTFLNLVNARKNPEAVAKYGAQPLANAEHEAFTYGLTRDNPMVGALMFGGIPVYDLAKRAGLMTDETTSAPGADQMAAGYRGLWRGISDSIPEGVKDFLPGIGRQIGGDLANYHRDLRQDFRDPFPAGQSEDFIAAIQQPPGQGPLSGVQDPAAMQQVLETVLDTVNPVPMGIGMTAWHGTPHRWPDDVAEWRRQIGTGEHVGTGEGAAAYGHGKLYAAENPSVAEGYQKDLGSFRLEVEGNPFDSMNPRHNAASLMNQVNGDRNLAILKLNRRADSNEKFLRDRGEWGFESSTKEMVKRDKKSAEILNSGENIDFQKVSTGNLYELDIPDEQIDKMLDWDAPLSEQSKFVREKVNSVIRLTESERDSMPIRSIYEMIGPAKEASMKLNQAGIPGIKYYDQGSRSAGEGTRNFVVFDENIVTPLSRNGEPMGLPMDEASRMGRAREMGFDVDKPLYHATGGNDWTEYDADKMKRTWLGRGMHMTKQPEGANRYAGQFSKQGDPRAARVMPVMTNTKNPADEQTYKKIYYDIVENNPDNINTRFGSVELDKAIVERLQKEGYDSIAYADDYSGDVVVALDPKNIRSRFAKFDPSKADSANILAGLGGLGLGTAALMGEDEQ